MKKTLALIGKGAGVCLFFWAAFLMLMTPRIVDLVPEDQKFRAYLFWGGLPHEVLKLPPYAVFCGFAETSVKRVGEDLYKILTCAYVPRTANHEGGLRKHLGTLRRLPSGEWNLVGVTVLEDQKKAPAKQPPKEEKQPPKVEAAGPSKLEVFLDRYLGGEADWSLFLEDLAYLLNPFTLDVDEEPIPGPAAAWTAESTGPCDPDHLDACMKGIGGSPRASGCRLGGVQEGSHAEPPAVSAGGRGPAGLLPPVARREPRSKAEDRGHPGGAAARD